MALLNKMTKDQLQELAANAKSSNSSQGGVIFTSGVYPITIKWVEISTKSSGSQQFVIRYEKDGKESTLFGPFIKNKDGATNKIGHEKLLELQAVCGVNEMNTVEKSVTVKDQTRPAVIIKELTGKKIYVQVVLEYGRYNGDITRSLKVVGFFRHSDKASMPEIAIGDSIGSRYEFVTKGDNPRCKEIRYIDGVTEEEAKAYEEARKIIAKSEKASASEEMVVLDENDNKEMPF